MLKLTPMTESNLSEVVPLFLDEAQTRYWEEGTPLDETTATGRLRHYLQLPSYHWILLWNEVVAGYGHLLRSDYLDAWIVSYLVHPDFQGRGLATIFVAETKAFARSEGIVSLCASIHPDNHASRRVVEKSGFEKVGEPTTLTHHLYRWTTGK